MGPGPIAIEVAYALPERQTVLRIDVATGTTAGDAIAMSGIVTLHPELADADPRIGIFGRFVGRDHVVEDGDRIELYRPLIADPKASRHARVAKKRAVRDNARNMRA